jgi:hypothetical protein
MNTENEKAVLDPIREALQLAHDHMRLHIPQYSPGRNVHDTVVAALQSQVSNTDGWVRELVTLLVRNDELLRMALLQLNAWQEKYGDAHPAWLPPAGDVPVMEAIANIREINKATLSAAPKAPQQVSNTDGWVPRGSVMSFLEAGTRYKIAGRLNGGAIFGLPKALVGRWVALVPADDDMHLLSAAPKAPQQVSNILQDGTERCYDCWAGLACVHQQQEQSGEVFDADDPKFREAFDAALASHNYPATRKGDLYRSSVVNMAWFIAYSVVNRLRLYASPATPTATASQASREEQMVTLRFDESGKPTVWCDPEIADLVDALNTDKLSTVASCSGHGHRPGRISLKDGRQLLVMNSEQVATVERLFDTNINGASQESAPGQEAEAKHVGWQYKYMYEGEEVTVLDPTLNRPLSPAIIADSTIPLYDIEPVFTASTTSTAIAAMPEFLSQEDLSDLIRVHECFDDGEGYDLPTPRMKELAALGLVHTPKGRYYYEITEFGRAIVRRVLDEKGE